VQAECNRIMDQDQNVGNRGSSKEDKRGTPPPQSENWPPLASTNKILVECNLDMWDENLVITCWFYVKKGTFEHTTDKIFSVTRGLIHSQS